MSQGAKRPGLLGTKRTALALYIVLLVLPTVVLGALHWRQIVLDQNAQLRAERGRAQNAAHQFEESIHRRLHELLVNEDEREFFVYKPNYFPPDTIGADLAFVKSKLATGPTPKSILCWFSYSADHADDSKRPTLLFGGRQADPEIARKHDDLLAATLEVRELHTSAGWLARAAAKLMRQRPNAKAETISLSVLAINSSDEEAGLDCLRDELPKLHDMQDKFASIIVTEFVTQFHREPDGTPRVFATRTVTIPSSPELEQMPACFAGIGRGAVLEEGFFIDPNWLFKEMPAESATRVLQPSQEFVPSGAALPPAVTNVVAVAPIGALRIAAERKFADYGLMHIAVNTKELEAGFRTQTLRFFGMAAMLVLSLVTGLLLLLRSVNRDLESARRTENFVAAVTHELRTPVASIKLYGEMLEDGWVGDEEKRQEYYRRISRETRRLETLVENVLEKSQLTRREIAPEPGDLNQAIESLAPALIGLDASDGPVTSSGSGSVKDLEFQYGEALPLVMLIPEGVRSIVTNLVENARKYAPPLKAGRPLEEHATEPSPIEPILVKTHIVSGSVTLDVLDRGPGIPPDERTRIFEAFYRVGNETTRTTRGTGLGLHLVALQSAAMGARVAVLDRKGGGTIFRVTFATAPTS